MTFAHPIVELRQYTLLPGQREVLIALFDREFVTGQEADGMAIIGQFRDLDREDRFVWMRGFPDMPSRLASLTAFYSGKCWKAHSAAANATMLDVSDVLLLHPVGSIDAPATSVEFFRIGVARGDHRGPQRFRDPGVPLRLCPVGDSGPDEARRRDRRHLRNGHQPERLPGPARSGRRAGLRLALPFRQHRCP